MRYLGLLFSLGPVILALDGDVLISKMVLSGEDTGMIAALALIQRIIFFASFALSSVIIPQIIEADQNGENAIDKITQVTGLFMLATLLALLILALWPESVINMLFGADYQLIARTALTSGLVATLITLHYLFVSYAMARQLYFAAWLFFVFALLQNLILKHLMSMQNVTNIDGIIAQKLILQIIFVSISIGAIIFVIIRERK